MSKEQYWQLAEFTSLIPVAPFKHTDFCFTLDDVIQAQFNTLSRSHRKELNKLKIKRVEQLTALYNEICHEFDIGKLSQEDRTSLRDILRENYVSCLKTVGAYTFNLPEKINASLDSGMVNKALIKIKKYNSEIAAKFERYKSEDLVNFDYLDKDDISAHYYQWLGVKPNHVDSAAKMYNNLIKAIKGESGITRAEMPLMLSKQKLESFLSTKQNPLTTAKLKKDEPDIQSASSNDRGHARLRGSFFRGHGPSQGIAHHIGTPVQHLQKAGSKIMKQARGG